MTKICFLIYAPDYKDNIGGNLALHSLAENLSLLGQEVYITSKKTRGFLNLKFVPKNKKVWDILSRENTVLVYPEIISDNPLNGKYICRWLLNNPGEFTSFDKFVPEGKLFKFAEGFNYKNYSAQIPVLRSFISKESIFKTNKKFIKREGTFYTLRKGKYKLNKLKIDPSWKEIKIVDDFMTDIYLKDIFQKAKYFISYDHASYLTIIAALCGCISIVIPSDDFPKETWRRMFPGQKYGVAYGFDDIQYAKETMPFVRENLRNLQIQSLKNIAKFIDYWNKLICEEKNRKYEKFNLNIDLLLEMVVKVDSRDRVYYLNNKLKREASMKNIFSFFIFFSRVLLLKLKKIYSSLSKSLNFFK